MSLGCQNRRYTGISSEMEKEKTSLAFFVKKNAVIFWVLKPHMCIPVKNFLNPHLILRLTKLDDHALWKIKWFSLPVISDQEFEKNQVTLKSQKSSLFLPLDLMMTVGLKNTLT